MNINIAQTGIKCDNPSCDYNDVNIEVTKEMIGVPCPKCGENLLTIEDFEIYDWFKKNVDFINTISKEDLPKLSEALLEGNPELAKLNEVLQGSQGLKISFHKELKIEPLTLDKEL